MDQNVYFDLLRRKTISLSEYENLKKEKAKREEELKLREEERRQRQEEQVHYCYVKQKLVNCKL